MEVNRYQFDSIVTKTKKTISPIKRGEEQGKYSDYLLLIEKKMSRFRREYRISGRQAMEILQLALFDIKSAVEKQQYDCSKLEEGYYRDCADDLAQLYLPEKNPNLKSALKKSYVENDDFFELARKCLIRVYESVELWTKQAGNNGYFEFIGQFGVSIAESEERFLIEREYLV